MKDKDFLNNPIFVRVLSLVIAIFLYIFVSTENQQYIHANRLPNTSVNVTETISNVPVYPGEMQEDMFVSGLKETADVRITGPRNILNQVITDELYVETEDLTDKEPGIYTVRLRLGGISEENIEYTLTPSWTTLEIDQLESRTVDISYELGENVVAEGYRIENVTIKPSQVALKSSQEVMGRIHEVKVTVVTSQPRTESFTETYGLQVKGREGNLLDVNASVTEVEVVVEVVPEGKTADIAIVAQGENKEDYSYQYAFTDASSVVLYGDPEDLAGVDQVPAVIDVSGLKESTILTASIQVPDEVEGVNLKQVPVSVTIIEKSDE